MAAYGLPERRLPKTASPEAIVTRPVVLDSQWENFKLFVLHTRPILKSLNFFGPGC